MKTRELIDVALKTGEILLLSGAEVYRVEETILRVFRSYGSDCECFVLLSGIFITAKAKNGETLTIVRRLKGHTFDLKKIELVNAFSRNLEKAPLKYEEAMASLHRIQETPVYNLRTRILFAGATAFVYALLFNGDITEAVVALFISMFVYLIKVKISEIGFFQFFEFFAGGFLVAGLALLALKAFPDLDIYKVLIGSLMILVPGVAITTGIKDALYGDIISSLYRLAEAIFISAAVGSGVGIVLSIGLRYL